MAIVLSVLRFTNSDYPFGIFKFFLQLIVLFLSKLQFPYWGSVAIIWRTNSPTAQQKSLITKFCWRKRDNCDCEFAHLSVFIWCGDPVNYYKNILTAFTLISVIVAAILILRNLKGIFGHFPVKGHIQGRWIHNFFFKGGFKWFQVQF